MSATRLGLFDGRLLTLFPRQLQNTAVSPTLLVKDKYARLVENIIPNTNKSGSGAKRFGLSTKGESFAPANITDMFEYRKSDGTLQIIVYVDDGSLWTLNEGAGVYTSIKSGLSTAGTIGALPFNGKLVFYNGIDRCFSWDGVSCTDLGEFVTDVLADDASFLQIDDHTISLKPNAVRGGNDYSVGTQIRVTFASGPVLATVASSSYNGGSGVLTVTVDATPFPTPIETISKVEYYAYPPAFSFMFAHLDMLWGLTPGELKAKIYRGSDGMKAYYQAAANNENSWFLYTGSNPTQEVPFINMRNKVPKFDELVGMSSIDGNAIFHGRKYVLIYTGQDPSTVGGFVWAKTIPVGTVHGKLIQSFPSDVLFATPYGMRSLRRVFQTEQAEVVPDLGSDIDPTIQQKLKTLMSEDSSYKKARSFYYEGDGFYGFKLDESLLVYVLSENSKGWVQFSGYFADAQAFLATTDGRLFVARNGQMYAYANGADPSAGIDYSDAGQAISCKWWTPWISAGAGRWSNRAWEVIMEDAETALFSIDRFINFNTRDVVTTQFSVSNTGAQWDEGMWDVDDFDGVPAAAVESDKFLADSFSFMLRHENTTGPLNILGVRPIGR